MDSSILGLMIFCLILIGIVVFVILAIPTLFIIGIIIAVKASKKEDQTTNKVDLTALEKLDKYQMFDIVSDIRKPGSRYIVCGEDTIVTTDNGNLDVKIELTYQCKVSGDTDECEWIPIRYLRKVKRL